MSKLPISSTAVSRAVKVLTEINKQNEDISPNNRQAKYKKMANSALDFYRGTNHLFWKDFAGDRRVECFGDETTRTWLQGDLHIENFGAFGNDEDVVVYNVNDFDEAVIADYQYDLWRMAVSIVLVARQNKKLTVQNQKTIVKAFAASYLEKLINPKSNDTSERLTTFLNKQEGNRKERRRKMLKKWTLIKDGKRCFNYTIQDDEGNLLLQLENDKTKLDEMRKAIAACQIIQAEKLRKQNDDYLKVKDVAWRLLAGTGSLGTPRFYVLIEGKSKSLKNDRILDIKRQSKPTAYHYLDPNAQIEYQLFLENNPGGDAKWHEAGYRALEIATDDHLGWLELNGEFYSIRERSFFKKAFPIDRLKRESDFVELAKQWGMTLAANHARALPAYDVEYFTGKGKPHQRYALNERVKERTEGHQAAFQDLVSEVAFSYADQVTSDWQDFKIELGQV